MVVCNKIRDGDKRIINIQDGNDVYMHAYIWKCTRTHTHNTHSLTELKIISSYNIGVAKDKDCVIVDDLVQTGGTLLECAKVCHHRTFYVFVF